MTFVRVHIASFFSGGSAWLTTAVVFGVTVLLFLLCMAESAAFETACCSEADAPPFSPDIVRSCLRGLFSAGRVQGVGCLGTTELATSVSAEIARPGLAAAAVYFDSVCSLQ